MLLFQWLKSTHFNTLCTFIGSKAETHHSPYGRPYDPIYTTGIAPANVANNTVYSSPGLSLIAIPPFWAVALKMKRYAEVDRADICVLLVHGLKMRGGSQWTEELLEKWLLQNCHGFGMYSSEMNEMRERIRHAIANVRYAVEQRDVVCPRQTLPLVNSL
jgi:hypothetical protein